MANFSTYGKRILIGFAVIEGIFEEGLDLVSEKLSGVVIVGVKMPKVCLEQEMIEVYFDATISKDFLFAYTFLGMNGILQAVGRVI